MQACERLGPEHKFDAVVVDEGQDFHELWWTSLESVFRDPDDKACYYVFFDPNQNLYVEHPCLPEEFGQPYVLPENCRNTVRIAAHCASLLGHEPRSRDGAPVGDEPEIVHARTMDDAFREAGRRVRGLCMPNLGGLRMSQVAVLAPGFSSDDWPDQVGVIPATKSFEEWGEDQGGADRFVASFQGAGGRCHRDHRDARQGRCQGARQSLRGAVAGEALA